MPAPVAMAPAASSPSRVVPFSQASGAHANVQRGSGDLLVENAPYSRVFHAAVVNTDGRYLYDLPAIAEPAGAVALALSPDGRVGLLKQWRPLPSRVPPADAFNFAIAPGLPERGIWSIEVPRGFPKRGEAPAEAAKREAQEELGVRVSQVVHLGFCNFNTSVLLTDIPIFAVLAHPDQPVADERDEAELIEYVSWMSVEDTLAIVARGEIRCGLSLAALLHLVASKLKFSEMLSSAAESAAG
eukprot:IDg16767t1